MDLNNDVSLSGKLRNKIQAGYNIVDDALEGVGELEEICYFHH